MVLFLKSIAHPPLFVKYFAHMQNKNNGRQPPPVRIATILLRGKIFPKKKDFREISSRLFVLAQKVVNSNSLSQAGFPCASSQRSKFRKPLRSSRLCPDARSSRAVEPALGQGMPRTMGHSQVRKWSKPHRGFAKKALAQALAHPLPKKLAGAIFAGALFLNILLQAKPRFCAAGPNLYPQGTYCS